MTEEMQDWTIKNEELDIKEDWEEADARYKEYIPAQNEARVKIETNQTINDFEDVQEWKIKNEELDIKEDLEKTEASISQDCIYGDNQVKCKKSMLQKIDQLDVATLLDNDLNEVKNDPCMDKIDLERPHFKHKYLEETKSGLLFQNEVEMYKSTKCDFQAKPKRNFKSRRLRLNPDQVIMTGRNSRSEEDILIIRALFQEHNLEIVQNRKLVSRKTYIWIHLSEKLNQLFTPGALYTTAAKHYYNVHFNLGIKKYLSSETKTDSNLSSCFQQLIIRVIIILIPVNKKKQTFQLFFDVKNLTISFLTMHCILTTSSALNVKRNYVVFQQRQWTKILYDKIDAVLESLN